MSFDCLYKNAPLALRTAGKLRRPYPAIHECGRKRRAPGKAEVMALQAAFPLWPAGKKKSSHRSVREILLSILPLLILPPLALRLFMTLG